MENKYYTPNIEDFHIGYCNYEILSEYIWTKQPPLDNSYDFNEVYNLFNEGKNNFIRVKYLDIQDIESLGWVESQPLNNFDDVELNYYKKENYSLLFYEKLNYIFISDIKNYNALFKGTCKSINELRKIMKWLNIQ